jgi:putative multiple sugar transport system permease protein
MSEGIAEKVTLRSLVKANLRNYSMVIMLALIMIIFAFLTGGVNLNSRNISNIFMQNSHILLLAVGMVMVIITCNIDLSVPSTCAFIGAISAMVYNLGLGMVPTILVSIALGAAIGAFNGAWIAFLKIPSFIVTLAGMLLFRGLTYIITNVTPVALKDDGFKQISSGSVNIPGFTAKVSLGGRETEIFLTALLVGAVLFAIYAIGESLGRRKKLKNNFHVIPASFFLTKIVLIGLLIGALSWKFATYRGIPTVVVVLGLAIAIFTFVLNNTILGRYIYAVGGNARSAKLSGINSELVVFIVFVIMGGITGLAGLVFTGYMNSALPQAGTMFDMDSIAACYIGGASASGGIGTIVGAIIGGLVMAGINNGMSLMNIAAQWQYVVKACILLLAVFYDIYTRRKAGLG